MAESRCSSSSSSCSSSSSSSSAQRRNQPRDRGRKERRWEASWRALVASAARQLWQVLHAVLPRSRLEGRARSMARWRILVAAAHAALLVTSVALWSSNLREPGGKWSRRNIGRRWAASFVASRAPSPAVAAAGFSLPGFGASAPPPPVRSVAVTIDLQRNRASVRSHLDLTQALPGAAGSEEGSDGLLRIALEGLPGGRGSEHPSVEASLAQASASAVYWPRRASKAAAGDLVHCVDPTGSVPAFAGVDVPSVTARSVAFDGVGAETARRLRPRGPGSELALQNQLLLLGVLRTCTQRAPPATSDVFPGEEDLVYGAHTDIALLHLVLLWVATSYAIFCVPNGSHRNLHPAPASAQPGEAGHGWRRALRAAWASCTRPGHPHFNWVNLCTFAWDLVGLATVSAVGCLDPVRSGASQPAMVFACLTLAWTAGVHAFWNWVSHSTQTLRFQEIQAVREHRAEQRGWPIKRQAQAELLPNGAAVLGAGTPAPAGDDGEFDMKHGTKGVQYWVQLMRLNEAATCAPLYMMCAMACMRDHHSVEAAQNISYFAAWGLTLLVGQDVVGIIVQARKPVRVHVCFY